METERTCLRCACFFVCSRISTDLQAREEWNGNNAETILRVRKKWNGNGHNEPEDFFRFIASECESFFNSGKTIELKKPVSSASDGS